MTSRDYRVYLSNHKDILESVNVEFDEDDGRIENVVKGETAADLVTDHAATQPVTAVSDGTLTIEQDHPVEDDDEQQLSARVMRHLPPTNVIENVFAPRVIRGVHID